MEYLYSDDGRVVITGEGACDWITLTTYDYWQWDLLKTHVENAFPKAIGNEFLDGYSGVKYADFLFMGAGKQQGKAHHILHASAYLADVVLRIFQNISTINKKVWSCTRIDIQVTLKPKARRTKLIKLGQYLKEGKYGPISNRRKINVRYQGSDTGDTIYIGSPTSEKMKRIYDKYLTDEDGNSKQYERYEIQYRKRTAQTVFGTILKDGIENISQNIQRIIKGDANLLPIDFQKKLSIYSFSPRIGTITINRAQKEAKESDTTRWVKSIRHALIRACRQSGDNGIYCREIMMRALAESITDNSLVDYRKWRLLDEYGTVITVAANEYNE